MELRVTLFSEMGELVEEFVSSADEGLDIHSNQVIAYTHNLTKGLLDAGFAVVWFGKERLLLSWPDALPCTMALTDIPEALISFKDFLQVYNERWAGPDDDA